MSETAEHDAPSRNVRPLVSPHLPADQGLSSLGLLLQAAGSMSAAVTCFFAFAAMWAYGQSGSMTVVLLLSVLAVVRALMHRAAGTELLYGAQPLRGIRRYITVGLAHAGVLMIVCVLGRAHVGTVVTLGAAAALWPALLWAIIRLPRFRQFEDVLPASEDKGFEGAAVLMTIFGAAGLLASGACLWIALRNGAALGGIGALLTLSLVLLVVRSLVHVAAGVGGLRHSSLDVAVERVGRYANLGIVSALVASAVLFLTSIGTRADFSAVLSIALTGYVLASWPLILRRYFGERHFSSLLLGDSDPAHSRSPDGGLTALGWLLILSGATQLAFVILSVGGSWVSPWDVRWTPIASPFSGVSVWLAGLVSAGLITAGLEIVRGSPHHRLITVIAGAVTLVLQSSALWPAWRSALWVGATPATVMSLCGSVLPLATAVAMVILPRRQVAPVVAATARPVRRTAAVD